MPLPPHMTAQAQEMARKRFKEHIIGKLRAKRLGAAVKQPEKKPDDELGGYDELEQMYRASDADKDDKGR